VADGGDAIRLLREQIERLLAELQAQGVTEAWHAKLGETIRILQEAGAAGELTEDDLTALRERLAVAVSQDPNWN
jgi:hypothetical protein